LLVAIPYLAALTAILLVSWHSDRVQERRWHAAGPLFIGAAALFLAIGSSSHLWTQLGFFSIFAACIYGYQPSFWSLPTITLGEYAAAASIGLINAIGNLGGFVGPFMLGYLVTRTGSFTSGLAMLLASLVLAGILVLRLRGSRRLST
jgi:nitrate/nitrite transporter NarK